jgi:hypothetical protein
LSESGFKLLSESRSRILEKNFVRFEFRDKLISIFLIQKFSYYFLLDFYGGFQAPRRGHHLLQKHLKGLKSFTIFYFLFLGPLKTKSKPDPNPHYRSKVTVTKEINVTYLNGKSPDVGEWNIAALLVQPVQQRAQGRQLNLTINKSIISVSI